MILLDVQLPDVDGFDVAARLATGADGPRVVITSSRDAADFGPLIQRSGALGFVAKNELSGEALASSWAVRLRMRIVIAEDSVLLREGMARLLEEAGLEVAGQAGDGEELIRKVMAHRPGRGDRGRADAADAHRRGLRAAQRIREELPGTGVLVLSQYVEEGYATELIGDRADGVGYLLKDRVADVDAFVDAVRRVGQGGSALDPEVVALMLGRRRDEPLSELTPREREVLALMAEGLSNHAIAERMVVTERAVEKHVTSIFGKLRLPPTGETHRRVLAVLAYVRA